MVSPTIACIGSTTTLKALKTLVGAHFACWIVCDLPS
jgi:hypothetical protein